jgi:hypothetical protein
MASGDRKKKPPVTLSNEVECDEASVIAGHKGQPEVVQTKERKGRRRRLKGQGGRGTLEKERPPVFGMIQPSIAFMLAWMSGDTSISVPTMDGASSLEMKMATACVKSMCIPWKGSGHSCGVGCARIGSFLKRNSRSTWVSSSLCPTSASEAKRCFLRSLSYWSRKTLESNMSDPPNPSSAA